MEFKVNIHQQQNVKQTQNTKNKKQQHSIPQQHLQKQQQQRHKNAAIVCESGFLFIQNKHGLYKVGSGYQSTIKGHLYGSNLKLTYTCDSKLFSFKEKLYLLQSRFLSRIDTNTMLPCELIDIHSEVLQSLNIFSDKTDFFCLQKQKETDCYKIKKLEIQEGVLKICSTSSSSSLSSSYINMSKVSLMTFGKSNFEEEEREDDEDILSKVTHSHQSISLGKGGARNDNDENDARVVGVAGGKEFWLAVTSSGHVMYRGKGHVLGLKTKNPVARQWLDFPIIKSPNIVQVSAGHDGYHVIMVSDKGLVYFAGVAKRGEDGDLNCFAKVRRTIKAVKPKRICRMDDKKVVWSACSYATSAMVTRDGQVYMFGKDAYMCDLTTGLLLGSKELDIVSLSLGKAHVVMLSRTGKVYSFGLNIKGQCGRAEDHFRQPLNVDVNAKVKDSEVNFCKPGSHNWSLGNCMVCSNCLNCTAFGTSCLNNVLPSRTAGSTCGCGTGDCGCSKCGICKLCAGELVVFCKPSLANGNNYLHKFKNNRPSPSLKASGNKSEHEPTTLLNLPIGQVILPLSANEIISQVSCGLQHTVLLTSHGNVFTFGSNQFGQLGTGDVKGRPTPHRVAISEVKQVAAGSYHTVMLHENGHVLTCGSNKSGQLGRPTESRESCYTPNVVPGYGGEERRKALWVGVSGDQTFVKVQASLITVESVKNSSVFADDEYIIIMPKGEEEKHYVMVDKNRGRCKMFSYEEDEGELKIHNEESSFRSFCFDHSYNLVWSYSDNKEQVVAYDLIKANIPKERLNILCSDKTEDQLKWKKGEIKNKYDLSDDWDEGQRKGKIEWKGGISEGEDQWEEMESYENGWGLPIHHLFNIPSSEEAFSTRSMVAINVLGSFFKEYLISSSA